MLEVLAGSTGGSKAEDKKRTEQEREAKECEATMASFARSRTSDETQATGFTGIVPIQNIICGVKGNA